MPQSSEHGLRQSLAADPAFGPLRGLLLLLTVVTGVVDAVSILALGRVFVANMTGNVVFASFAVVGAPGFSLSASLFALAGFLVGAYGGGLLIARSGRDRGSLLRAGTAVELALVVIALVLGALSGDPGASHGTVGLSGGSFGAVVTDAMAALLAIAMGLQNAVANKLAVPDLTTTVLTRTLTGLGADLHTAFLSFRAIERRGHADNRADEQAAWDSARADLVRRLLAVGATIAGAAAGAVLVLHVSAVAAVALATALLAAVTIGATAAAWRPAAWRTPRA